MAKGVAAIRAHEVSLTRQLVEGLSTIPDVTVYGPSDAARRTAVVSFTVRNRRVSEIGLILDEEYGILARVGLHCAPAAHRTIGTFPEGTVRLAPGIFTSDEDVDAALGANRGARQGMSALGVVLFHTTSAALRAEKTLLKSALSVKLVPTPREFSSDCGVALRFAWDRVDQVRALLAAAHVEIAGLHQL